MEQRNGRIDRFGQTSKSVLISTMYAENNPVDNIVLNVLYKKQDEIKKKLGVYLPIADNDASLMESIMERIMTINAPTKTEFMQLIRKVYLLMNRRSEKSSSSVSKRTNVFHIPTLPTITSRWILPG